MLLTAGRGYDIKATAEMPPPPNDEYHLLDAEEGRSHAPCITL